jgi:tetratricopeptide (TPR) repeat protein
VVDSGDEANGHYRQALEHSCSGQWDKAISANAKAIELNPKSAKLHNNLAWLLATCPDSGFRDPKRAIGLAKKAVELVPSDGNLWNTLGTAEYRAGDWKATITALEKSMDMRQGGDSFDWFFLAMARWQLGDKEKSRQWYEKAVQWMEKNQPKNEELSRFREEAEKLLELKK